VEYRQLGPIPLARPDADDRNFAMADGLQRRGGRSALRALLGGEPLGEMQLIAAAKVAIPAGLLLSSVALFLVRRSGPPAEA
jgi:hypothetical protein